MTAPERIWAWPTNYTIEGGSDDPREWRWVPHYEPIDMVEAGQAWTAPRDPEPVEFVHSDLYTALLAEKERLERERDEWQGRANGHEDRADALASRVRELEALVEKAYCEGFDYAVTLDPDCEWSGGNQWPDSDAKRARSTRSRGGEDVSDLPCPCGHKIIDKCDCEFPYRHHGPAVHGSKLMDYLISEANLIEEKRRAPTATDTEGERT
jgi:hypothetical protein